MHYCLISEIFIFYQVSTMCLQGKLLDGLRGLTVSNIKFKIKIKYFNTLFLGPTTQILLAGNRLMAVYFPKAYHAKYSCSPNRVSFFFGNYKKSYEI